MSEQAYTQPSRVTQAGEQAQPGPAPAPARVPRGARRLPGRVGRHFSQRGVALIAVSVAMAIAGAIVTEFSTNTNVDMFAAHNIEADMKAHFLARSGMNLSQLVVSVQTGVIDKLNQQFKMDIQLADYTGMFIGAFGGSQEEVEGLAAMIGGIDAKNIKGLGVPGGSFDVQISTDDGKVNLNCAGHRTGDTQKTLVAKLQSLFFFDAYNPLFENEDAEGWRRDRNLQIEALIDYVDPDATKYDAANLRTSGGPEDYGYESLTDKYLPKNQYLDTVGEIKLVRGVDDRFWTLFGKNFTVYGGCKENLGAISDPGQLAAVMSLAAKNPDDPVLRDPNKLWALAALVLKAKSLGMAFVSTSDFIDFVKDPEAALGALAGDPSNPSNPSGGAAAALLGQTGGQPIEGIELDKTKLDQLVGTGARRTYRVEATATYGNLSKRIVGVWDKDVTPQNARTQSGAPARGAWVFWREE